MLDIPNDIQTKLDVVEIFRPSKYIPPIVDDVIEIFKKTGHPKAVWMQLGITNQEARSKAEREGIQVVMDRCMRGAQTSDAVGVWNSLSVTCLLFPELACSRK